MDDRNKTKAQLMEALAVLRGRVRDLEAVERKYEALKEKIRRLRGVVGDERKETPFAPARKGRAPITVLVVDDNDVFRDFIVSALSVHGYKVLAAGGSAEALQVMDKHARPVDLIIADVVMPKVSGSELVKKVKVRYPKVKVIYISGYTDDILIHSDVQEVIESDAAFLQKPFLTEDLLKSVRKELGVTNDNGA